jgi:hypothetical protein
MLASVAVCLQNVVEDARTDCDLFGTRDSEIEKLHTNIGCSRSRHGLRFFLTTSCSFLIVKDQQGTVQVL